MTGLSDKAFAIMAVCEESKKPFGITVETISVPGIINLCGLSK